MVVRFLFLNSTPFLQIILDIGAVTEYGIAVKDDFLSRTWRGLEELSFTWDW